MRNALIYFYNINPDKIMTVNDYFYFYFRKYLYIFVIYDRRIEEIDAIVKLNKSMLNAGIKVHEIIINKDMQALTFINNIPYILLRVYNNSSDKITLNNINNVNYFSPEYDSKLTRGNWNTLWSDKIDYLEYQINQNGKKYPIIVESFSYFVGMTENAISYIKNATTDTKPEQIDYGVVSHNRISMDATLYDLYNPLNLIIDHKTRDIAEYIKNSFFCDNTNIFKELDDLFSKNYFSLYGIKILYGRILYPSFYFDMYDDIIAGKIKEEELINVINRMDDYEVYLKEIYIYLNRFYPLPEVNWLLKK